MDPPRSALLIINVSLGTEIMSSDTPDLCSLPKLPALFALKDCFKVLSREQICKHFLRKRWCCWLTPILQPRGN